ncbi:hypothetical protein RQP46_003345 [Phenoliferia psychrophenolica]
MDVSDLKGQAVMITGAGAGDANALAATVKELNLAPGDIISTAIDITDDVAVEAFVRSVPAKFGRLDIALNCAGVLGKTGDIGKLTMDDYDFVMNINLRAQVLMCRLEAEIMLEQEHLGAPARARGCIVNWSSWIGNHATAISPNYGISKWGVVSLTRTMCMTYGKSGIRINCVSPGFINTPFQQDPQMAASQAKIPTIVPQGRSGEAEEVAKAAMFLSSSLSSYVNGHNLFVDGGWNAA